MLPNSDSQNADHGSDDGSLSLHFSPGGSSLDVTLSGVLVAFVGYGDIQTPSSMTHRVLSVLVPLVGASGGSLLPQDWFVMAESGGGAGFTDGCCCWLKCLCILRKGIRNGWHLSPSRENPLPALTFISRFVHGQQVYMAPW